MWLVYTFVGELRVYSTLSSGSCEAGSMWAATAIRRDI